MPRDFGIRDYKMPVMIGARTPVFSSGFKHLQNTTDTQNQLTVMCTTRGERRLIGFRCHKACMKSKLIISCRMMHNLIKRVMRYFTD